MGEVATALAAFDDAFGRTLDALRASDVSEGSAWPTQKRASSLVLDLRRDVPAHVAAAKLVAAGELALSQGQWALAQTSCFAHVLALGLVRAGAETDPRWHPNEADDAKGEKPFGRLDRVALHVRAVLGNARCDVTRVRHDDAGVRLTSSRNALRAAANDARDAAALAMETHESLYWLVRNATGVVRDAGVAATGAGYGADVVHALVFAVRALESHALLATPRHLSWRLSLVAAAVACLDDCAAADASGGPTVGDAAETGDSETTSEKVSSDANVRAAGDAFLRSAKDAISDLKSLEAMDATPMDDARRRAYEEADARLAAMEAARDPAAAEAFAETLLSADPETDDREDSTGSETDLFPSRFLLEALSSASGAAFATLAEATKAWVARRTDAAFAFHAHARAVATHEARTAEAEARVAQETQETQETREGEATPPEEHDRVRVETEPDPSASEDPSVDAADANGGSPEKPLAPPEALPPGAAAAHARTVRELPVSTHVRLLTRTRSFADGAAFGALVRYANLRAETASGPVTSGPVTVETAASAEDAAAAATLRRVVDLLVAAHCAEGKAVEGGERLEALVEEPSGNRADANVSGEETRDVPAIARVCAALEAADADVASLCAEATLAAGAFAWRFAREKLEAFQLAYHASSDDHPDVDLGAYRPVIDPEDEPDVVAATRAAAAPLADARDGATRAVVYLRLADLLERRGGVDNLRDALECASAAVTALDAARDDGAANAMAEDVSGALAARGNLSEAVFFSEGTAVPSEAGLTKSANVSDAKDPGTFAFVPADVPESAKRLACLHADAVAKTAHLRCKARLAAMGVAADRGVRALPAELREELNAVAADNKWEAAAARTESALFTRRVSVRDASLAEAADLMEQAERAERRAFLRGAPSSASEKRLLTPDAPVVLGATSGSVTLLPPDFSRLRHALRGAGATSVATHFAVVCVPFGAGFAPTVRNDGFPGTGVRREIENRESRERSPVTITGLTKNVAYAFAVVAFDASGVVINGVGAATEPVLAAHAVSSTCAWSRLAVVASRLGCAPIAARAAATVRRRFCVIDTHDLEKDENDEASSVLPRCPVTSQRLRRDVVRLAAPATLRAASRAMLVSAEAAAAARLEPFELEQFDAFLESDRAPLPELRVTKHREHLTRLDVAKRCVLAMELAGYAGDEALAQEACLRAGNFLAELFVSPGKKPRATLGLLNQACALLEECGKARTPAFARLAASIAHELVREARAFGESAVLSRVARVTMTLDAMTPPLGARALSRSAAEETLLSFVEWRSFGAAALADRAEAAAADEARDPVAAVYAALGADASGSSPGASAGYEALANLLTPESLAEDPGPFARALCVALDAASARIEAGDASENSVGKTHAMVEEWATSVFAMCDESAAVPPTAFPESSGADDDYTGTPLEEADEARVAEIEATAEEARVVFDAGAPEEVATNADADIVAAHERATAEYEAAKVAVETAVAAREDALTRAASRERAARRLTRLLPPLFARRGAALQARPLVAALTPWRARACVALGRVAWEARETEVRFRTAGEPPVDPNSAETETPEKTESSEEQKALAVRAVTLLTRGVELGARAGCHHTIAAATRALYDLARSPVLGHEADARFAKGGGARSLAVAGGRVLEHLRRLKEDAENTARCARERDRETDLCASEEPDDDESAPLTSKGLFPETRAVFRKDSDPTSDLVSVAGGARVSPLAAAAAREKARRRATKKALAPENADSNARHAFKSLAVAFASENKPAFLDGGVTVWFASRPGIGIETLVRFVELAIEICVAAGFHRRASNLALELCDVVGTARVALDVLPKTLPSLRLCEAEDKEVGPALADAAESALRRARAEVPEHVATLRAARASLFPPDDPSGAGTKAPAEPLAVASRAKQTVALYRAATRAASAAGDRPTASQAQLELGDALCAAGELEEATRAWGSCLDGVVGRYDVAFDASGGGCRSLLPSTPEATLGMFGLRGCLRAANAAARLATRTVRKPFRAADVGGVRGDADDADDDDADVKNRTSPPLGVGARVEIARVASRFLEAASRASLGDARFFGGGFCGWDEPDAASAAAASPGPETDVSWETIGDGVVDGWDAFLFDARATCDDALAVSDLLLRAGRAPESAAAASLAEALAARRLRDFRRVVDARLKRSAAMADIGALGVSAALLLTAVEGTDLPSIAGGAAGRTLAPPPPRGVPAENGEDAEDADATPTSPPGPPRFADEEPLWSARNARAASYVATVPVAEAVSAAYGEPLAEAVELARARWLLAAAAAAAPKARGVDVETDAVFFARGGVRRRAAAPGGEGGGGGDADSSETFSHDPGVATTRSRAPSRPSFRARPRAGRDRGGGGASAGGGRRAAARSRRGGGGRARAARRATPP